jgi:CheY-like chemotaxis protein
MLKDALLAVGRGHGVLVVDDDADVRDALDAGLRREGFAVWLAADGQAALDLYRNHSETIDVVLLDVRMPGLDGPQTLAALQQLTPQIRCCFMTGYLGSHSTQELRRLGADAVLMKPFHLSEVARVLRTMTHPGRSCAIRRDRRYGPRVRALHQPAIEGRCGRSARVRSSTALRPREQTA